jgi:hypothetical protein
VFSFVTEGGATVGAEAGDSGAAAWARAAAGLAATAVLLAVFFLVAIGRTGEGGIVPEGNRANRR